MQDPTQIAKLMLNYGLPIFLTLVVFYKILLPILKIIASIIVAALMIVQNYLLKLLEFSRKKAVKKPKGEEIEPGVFLMED
jgi:hypothetical protein